MILYVGGRGWISKYCLPLFNLRLNLLHKINLSLIDGATSISITFGFVA